MREVLGMHGTGTLALHPRSNGVAERMSGMICRIGRWPWGGPSIVHFGRLVSCHGYGAAEAIQSVRTLQRADSEFDRFIAGLDLSQECKVTTIRSQDLYTLSGDYTLACSVTGGLESSKGVASVFGRKIGGPPSLELSILPGDQGSTSAGVHLPGFVGNPDASALRSEEVGNP